MPLRAAIYVRQSVKEDEGIKQQIEHCKAMILARDWQALEKPYVDNFVSASKPRDETTAWAAMLTDIDAGLIDVIVTVTVDRLLRRVTDVTEVTEPKRTVRIVTARDGIDTAASMGKMMLTVITALAENEIETKNARMKPYADARHKAGHPTPGLVPYGYAWIPKLERDKKTEVRYAVVEAEAAVVKHLFTQVVTNERSIAVVCREMNDKGMLTRKGMRWGTSTVRRILISPFYAALLPERTVKTDTGKKTPYRAQDVDMSKTRPGKWTRILTEDQVRAARHKLLDSKRLTHDGDTSRKWLLTGIATCGTCGGGIRSAITKEKYRGYRGYPCHHFQRRADVIDQYVENAVIDVLSTPGVLVRLPEDGVDLPALYARRTALEGRQLEARLMWRSNEFTRTEYVEEKALLETEIVQINAQLAAASKGDPLAKVVAAEDLRTVWANLAVDQKQIITRALLERVSIHPVGKGRRINTVESVAGTVILKWRNEVKRYSFKMPLDEQTGTVEKSKYTEKQARTIVKALNAA